VPCRANPISCTDRPPSCNPFRTLANFWACIGSLRLVSACGWQNSISNPRFKLLSTHCSSCPSRYIRAYSSHTCPYLHHCPPSMDASRCNCGCSKAANPYDVWGILSCVLFMSAMAPFNCRMRCVTSAVCHVGGQRVGPDRRLSCHSSAPGKYPTSGTLTLLQAGEPAATSCLSPVSQASNHCIAEHTHGDPSAATSGPSGCSLSPTAWQVVMPSPRPPRCPQQKSFALSPIDFPLHGAKEQFDRRHRNIPCSPVRSQLTQFRQTDCPWNSSAGARRSLSRGSHGLAALWALSPPRPCPEALALAIALACHWRTPAQAARMWLTTRRLAAWMATSACGLPSGPFSSAPRRLSHSPCKS
jgi:hypothetical protein